MSLKIDASLSNIKVQVEAANNTLESGNPMRALHEYEAILNGIIGVVPEQILRTIWANKALCMDALGRHADAVSAMDNALKYIASADDRIYSAFHVLREELVEAAIQSKMQKEKFLEVNESIAINSTNETNHIKRKDDSMHTNTNTAYCDSNNKRSKKINFGSNAIGVALLAGYGDARELKNISRITETAKSASGFAPIMSNNGRHATSKENEMLEYISRLDSIESTSDILPNRISSKNLYNKILLYKSTGNDAMKRGNVLSACSWYTKGLYALMDITCSSSRDGEDFDELQRILLSNRSAAFMALHAPHLALADAYTLLDSAKGACAWPKTFLRLGNATAELGGQENALEWFKHGVSCAEMQHLKKEQNALQRAVDGIRNTGIHKTLNTSNETKSPDKILRTENEQVAIDLGLDSAMFYRPFPYLLCLPTDAETSENDETKAENIDFENVGKYKWKKRNLSVSNTNATYFSSICKEASSSAHLYRNIDKKKRETCWDGRANMEVRHIKGIGGGRGVFATRDFKRGDIVFVESPFITISRDARRCHLERCIPTLKRSGNSVLPNGVLAAQNLKDLRKQILHSNATSDKKTPILSQCFHSLAAARIFIMMIAKATASKFDKYCVEGELNKETNNSNNIHMFEPLHLPKQIALLLSCVDIIQEKKDLTPTNAETSQNTNRNKLVFGNLKQEIFMPFTQRYNEFVQLRKSFGLDDVDLNKQNMSIDDTSVEISADASLHFDPRIDFSTYDFLWGVLLLNSIWTGNATIVRSSQDDDKNHTMDAVSESISLLEIGSYLNHFREPNMKIDVHLEEINIKDSECEDNDTFFKETIIFRATKEIKMGEELTISYYDSTLTEDQRQSFLQRNYFFQE